MDSDSDGLLDDEQEFPRDDIRIEMRAVPEIELSNMTAHSDHEDDREALFLPYPARFQENGLQWSGPRHHKRKFIEAFPESMRSVNLDPPKKLVVIQRFLGLAHKYRSLKLRWMYYSNISSAFISIGSLIVPALVLLEEEQDDRPPFSQGIAYVVFVLSFSVAVVNGLKELFSATKRYITFNTTEEALVSEGWSFVTLSGKYHKYKTHEDCWQTFCRRVEGIHGSAVTVNMALARAPSSPSAAAQGKTRNSSQQQQLGGLSTIDEDVDVSPPPVIYTDH